VSRDVLGATGQLLNGNIPIFCGGTHNECECYTFQNSSWEKTPDPAVCRKFPSSAILNLPDGKELLFLAGSPGRAKRRINSVETFDGTVWDNEQFDELPEVLSGNCIVKVNSSVLLSIGGIDRNYTPTNSTYFFDAHINRWLSGPSINTPRTRLSCGLLKRTIPDSDKIANIVVIVGGETEVADESLFLDSVELLYLDEYGIPNEEWIPGPELPKKSSEATMVELENSVILVGGGVDQQRNLYELSSPEGPWTKMRQSLKTERSYHVAFLVPDEIVTCHR